MTPPSHTSEPHNQSTQWLESYLQALKSPDDKQDTHNKKSTMQQLYQLPLGQLRVLRVTAAPSVSDTKTTMSDTRSAAIKFGLRWKKALLKQDEAQQIASAYVLIVEIKPTVNSDTSIDHQHRSHNHNHNHNASSMSMSFATKEVIEQQSADAKASGVVLQVFGRQDWLQILATLQTPNELWRLLDYHKAALQKAFVNAEPSFASEQTLLSQFMASPAIYTQALTIDNALIKYGIQDEPNSRLVAMSLAQRNKAATTKRFHEQMRQASILWYQLSAQMLSESSSARQLPFWQRQLLAESLFSRYELIRTLYQHPSRSMEQQQTGYVVHQHSYENLGQHYVLIFYGQQSGGKQSREALAPNLATIAKDVSTRLPIAELHHVIVLGIEFIVEAADTFIDIDLFIQPVTAMSEKERQLTRQLQRLHNQQQRTQKSDATDDKSDVNKSKKPLPTMHLSLNIPASKKQS
ncbi:hypothetical protein [uncultured Psychrobacter sp.]|uniref:hypothetical protein n=1 Tax=uncultured Psychrobacter sp. TaxID=259303 RepID=UPI00262CF51C|nr:hypothetical protein [uncultured Psychrobacter sp.]